MNKSKLVAAIEAVKEQLSGIKPTESGPYIQIWPDRIEIVTEQGVVLYYNGSTEDIVNEFCAR